MPVCRPDVSTSPDEEIIRNVGSLRDVRKWDEFQLPRMKKSSGTTGGDLPQPAHVVVSTSPDEEIIRNLHYGPTPIRTGIMVSTSPDEEIIRNCGAMPISPP